MTRERVSAGYEWQRRDGVEPPHTKNNKCVAEANVLQIVDRKPLCHRMILLALGSDALLSAAMV